MAQAYRRFSEELKIRVVAEIEGGQLSLREAARDVQAPVTVVHKWLEEYGRFKPKRDIVEVVMKSEQEKIAALEKALADAHLRLRVYDELITQANKLYKTDLKKSFGMPSSAPTAMSSERFPSPPSAAPSDARATRITNARAAAPSSAPHNGARTK